MKLTRALMPMTVLTLMSGCADIPPDRGRGAVDVLLSERGLGAARPASTVLADGALDLSEAVLLALANNPELGAEYAALGFPLADIDEAGRLGNPRVSLAYLFAGVAGEQNEKSFELGQSFTALILMPSRKRLARAEFERLQLQVAASGQQLAHEVAVAWYALIASREHAREQSRIAELARLSAELVARYVDAGNLESTAAAEARLSAAAARLDALAAETEQREAAIRFERLLGVRAPVGGWPIPEGMPQPPAAGVIDAADAVAAADADRLDLAAARRAVTRFADALGVTRRFRYLGDIELGGAADWNDVGSRSSGPLMALEIPLFDQGQGDVLRAEAALGQAEAELEAVLLDVAADLERALSALRIADERYQVLAGELLPATREIVARTREKVDFMLASPFDLLMARQHEFSATRDTLAAAGDYWQARLAVAHAIGQPPPDPTGLPRLQLLDAYPPSVHQAGANPHSIHQPSAERPVVHQNAAPENGGHQHHRHQHLQNQPDAGPMPDEQDEAEQGPAREGAQQ